jgi:tetratricopeptide (TPR) repeat protein
MVTRTKRVPAKIAGALFFYGIFLAVSSAAEPAILARSLYEEGAWQSCGREAARVLIRNPDDGLARAVLVAARLRLATAGDSGGGQELLALATNVSISAAAQALAGYERGRAFSRLGQREKAVAALDLALAAAGEDPFLAPVIALCLHRTLQSSADAVERRRAADLAEIWRNAWTGPVRAHVGEDPSLKPGFFSLPGRGITWFYRTQVRPAIGDRCKMEPSCSEYFRQASAQYGLLAFPMIADRGVREPSEVSAARHPVWSGREWRVADPLASHDVWFRSTAGYAWTDP